NGDEAWSPADFKDANVGNVGRAPSPTNESCVGRAPSPAKETHVARTPSSAKEPSPAKQPSPNSLPAKPTSPDQISKQLSPAAGNPVRPIQVRPIQVRPPLSPVRNASWSILTGSSKNNCNPHSTALNQAIGT